MLKLTEKMWKPVEKFRKRAEKIRNMAEENEEMVKKYRYSLKKLNNYLKLLYSNSSTLSYDMTKDEIINGIYEQIIMMEECIEEMSTMFGVVHSRYKSRLGFE